MSLLKQLYKVLTVACLVYAGWYLFALITQNNDLIWKAMDVIGVGTVMFVMVAVPFVLILLSFGNIKWIPEAKIAGKKFELVILILGIVIAIISIISFVMTLF